MKITVVANRMVGRVAASVALALGLTVIAPLSQAEQWCTGKVTRILTEGDGDVQVLTTFRGEWLQVCNLTTTWKGVTPDICKSWVATLTTLRVTQEPALLFYTDSTPCNSIAAYGSAPAPGYVAIDQP